MMAGKIEPMSERAQALEAALRALGNECHAIKALSYDEIKASAGYTNLKCWTNRMDEADALLGAAAPPVGVSPQPDTALKEAATWVLNVVSGVGRAGGEPEPDEGHAAFQALADALSTPDAQVCVWREGEWDYESGCRGTQISRDERSSGPPDGWKHCPYCGKRLEVGTAPQGGEQ